jgi:hypothetical protein
MKLYIFLLHSSLAVKSFCFSFYASMEVLFLLFFYDFVFVNSSRVTFGLCMENNVYVMTGAYINYDSSALICEFCCMSSSVCVLCIVAYICVL